MARDETDREDLLRDATALVERIELAPVEAADRDADDRIITGFRTNGALSIFFGSDPVYQFNAAGELRRAYVDGLLFKAVGGRMISLQRQRSEKEVGLFRRELADSTQAAFIETMQARLRKLRADIHAARLHATGQVPAETDVLGRVCEWLAAHDGTPIARSPGV